MRHRCNGRRRITLKPYLKVFDKLLPHLFVRQAQLGPLMFTLTVDFAEPFGMVLEVRLRPNQRKESMYKTLITMFAAAFGVQPFRVSITLVPHRPIAVKSVKPERLTVF